MQVDSIEGDYIAIEGIDGAGTTTISEEIVERMSDAVWTCEPTDLWTGKATRRAFEEEDAHPLTTFYLFMADRFQHDEEFIEPNLRDGHTVVSDRGPDSTRAYQYHALGKKGRFIERHLKQCRDPHLTIWIDTDIDMAWDRSKGEDHFEEYEFQVKVRDRYKQLWHQMDRVKKVDGDQPVSDVVDDAMEIINDTF